MIYERFFKRPVCMIAVSAVVLSTATVSLASEISENSVVMTYADIAEAIFEDSLSSAEALSAAVKAFTKSPSKAGLDAARSAWIAARVPYQQSEVYRFGNAKVDDWEGRVNAWPLDEGLIDYVSSSYGAESDENALYTVNVVANKSLTVNGAPVDASVITPKLLSATLHEAEGVEANVATGYHAIEFLLWGQDLNGTNAGAGNRPYTDFDVQSCTGGNCERRIQYLEAATELLISDLQEMLALWRKDGAARADVLDDPAKGISAMLTGMGSLSYGELAGERMKLGLLLKDPEEEHDCFSDNTHNSHYFDQIGIRNVYTGHYRRPGGEIVSGPSLSDLVKKADPKLDADLTADLNASVVAMAALKTRAETIEAYDQMIGEGNEEGNAVVQNAIDKLILQTRAIERAVVALGIDKIEIEGSDSLDNVNAVFK
ncbi:MAG: peptidase [Proteobacteria bacterium]|nr:peptidase [Pseudomonadota bacterium]